MTYRQGSLGDTVVALPCFRLIRSSFPNAKHVVLTNKPITSKACALEAVLENTGLVDEYVAYPAKVSIFKKLFVLRSLVKKVKPDVMIYLVERPSALQSWRDFLFFKLCGIKKIIGLSLFGDKQEFRFDAVTNLFEYEGKRLARQIEGDLGEINWDDLGVMSLDVAESERSLVNQELASLNDKNIVVCSVGTKLEIKSWGQDNWKNLISKLTKKYQNLALVFIGVSSEYAHCQELLDLWSGSGVNLCGALSVRQSAALLERAKLFVGHDSGPMHLAAASGVQCVAIFSRHNRPGCWYPFGSGHRVIYPKGESIRSITVDDVVNEIDLILS